jgi:hypothetical protein
LQYHSSATKIEKLVRGSSQQCQGQNVDEKNASQAKEHYPQDSSAVRISHHRRCPGLSWVPADYAMARIPAALRKPGYNVVN